MLKNKFIESEKYNNEFVLSTGLEIAVNIYNNTKYTTTGFTRY